VHSVYLKQVGLITLLASIGSYVPADRATISTVDRIFSAMTVVDSINISQSSFSQDLAHVSAMLRHCTGRSLLLIDEFGSGTAPTDGIALLVGVVNELLDRGLGCPKTLLTTHYTEAFRYLPVDNSLLKFQQMEIASSADTSSSTQSADIVFLYNLVEGRSNMSHGRLCVRSAWCLVFDIIECLTVVSGCVYGQGCHGWRRARRARPCGCYS